MIWGMATLMMVEVMISAILPIIAVRVSNQR